MKIVQYSRTGKPDEVVELIDAEPPVPGPGEVLIDVEAAPINPSHLLALEGKYGVQPDLPTVPGAEGVGRIAGLGDGVTDLAIGRRVMIPAYAGTWRQQLSVDADRIAVTYPDRGDPIQLSMLMANPPTAQLLLRHGARLTAGDWVVQNAANSAVGRYVIQLARLANIHTVNIVRREGLGQQLTELGADRVLVDGPDLGERVRDATGAAPVGLGFDAVGGAATARLAACLADGGTLVNYGLLSGTDCEMPAADLIFRDLRLRGFWFTRWLRDDSTVEERAALYGELADHVVEGRLIARVAATYKLDRIRQAVAHAMQDGRDGKIVLTPNA